MDEKLEGLAQKEFEEMKDQVTQLEDRWLHFRRRLTTAVEDNKRAVRRQREFDQEHMKICSVLETILQGTRNTGLDQTDMAVDLERAEVCVYCFHLNGFMAVIPFSYFAKKVSQHLYLFNLWFPCVGYVYVIWTLNTVICLRFPIGFFGNMFVLVCPLISRTYTL